MEAIFVGMRAFLHRCAHWTGRFLAAVVPPVVAVGLCFAVLWEKEHGDRGTLAQQDMHARIEQERQRLAAVVAERDAIRQRVESLRGETLDRDLLDERARHLLGLSGRDELVLPLNQAPAGR